MQLSGVYCPIVTPFADDKLTVHRLEGIFEKWRAAYFQGYVVLGSTGESVYLSLPEKEELLRAARRHIPDDQSMIVGTGAESTVATIDLTKRAADFGADFALVKTPFYYRGQYTDECLIRHYTDIADISPIPLILYNVPKFTGLDLNVTVIKKLSDHTNIAGIKDSTGDFAKFTDVMVFNSNTFSVTAGSAALFFPALLLGAPGAILGLCNIAARECTEIFTNVADGKIQKARETFLRVLPLGKAIVGYHGIPGIKAAMEMLGYDAGAPRRPLLPARESAKAEIRTLLSESQLLED